MYSWLKPSSGGIGWLCKPLFLEYRKLVHRLAPLAHPAPMVGGDVAQDRLCVGVCWIFKNTSITYIHESSTF